MKYLGFKATTSGERLFQHLLQNIIEARRATELIDLSILQTGGRAEQFSEYFLGTYTFNLMARCVKKASRIKESCEDETLHQPTLVKYFQQSLGMADHPTERKLDRLATLTFNASDSSGKKISDATKRSVRNNKNDHYCYICGMQILKAAESPDSQIEYEHIWPSSYGGDSSAENLLPACPKCNRLKSDLLLWQDTDVHSFILPPAPVEEEWKRIERRVKIAKHRYQIFEVACTRGLSLKEAAIELGPVNMHHDSLYANDEDDCVDFFNFSIRNA